MIDSAAGKRFIVIVFARVDFRAASPSAHDKLLPDKHLVDAGYAEGKVGIQRQQFTSRMSFGRDGQCVLSLSLRRVKYHLVVPPELLEQERRGSLLFHFVKNL